MKMTLLIEPKPVQSTDHSRKSKTKRNSSIERNPINGDSKCLSV